MRTVLKISTFNCIALGVLSSLCYANVDVNGSGMEVKQSSQPALENISPADFAARSLKNSFAKNNAVAQSRGSQYSVTETKTAIFTKMLVKYVKDIYNQRDYAKALSQDPSHIIKFFEESNELNVSMDAFYVGLRLFYNKLKECEIVDATMILDLLKRLPPLLERYFGEHVELDVVADFDSMQKNMELIIISKCTEKLPEFAIRPQMCAAEIAQDLTDFYRQQIGAIQQKVKNFKAKERLRDMLIKFFELSLSKAMWYVREREDVWQTFVDLSNQLYNLGNCGVIDHSDDLDDLFWSLVLRYCFFIDLMGPQLPLTFYDEVEQALENKSVSFLELGELDKSIMSKKDILLENLLVAKVRALAFAKKGIMAAQ